MIGVVFTGEGLSLRVDFIRGEAGLGQLALWLEAVKEFVAQL